MQDPPELDLIDRPSDIFASWRKHKKLVVVFKADGFQHHL